MGAGQTVGGEESGEALSALAGSGGLAKWKGAATGAITTDAVKALAVAAAVWSEGTANGTGRCWCALGEAIPAVPTHNTVLTACSLVEEAKRRVGEALAVAVALEALAALAMPETLETRATWAF